MVLREYISGKFVQPTNEKHSNQCIYVDNDGYKYTIEKDRYGLRILKLVPKVSEKKCETSSIYGPKNSKVTISSPFKQNTSAHIIHDSNQINYDSNYINKIRNRKNQQQNHKSSAHSTNSNLNNSQYTQNSDKNHQNSKNTQIRDH